MVHMRGVRLRRVVVAAAVVAVMALVAGCGPEVGRVALRQPAKAPRVWDASDPAVLLAGGELYLYGSTNNMKLPVRHVDTFSTTLDQSRRQWATGARDAMPTRPAWVHPSKHGGTWQIWAPTVAKIGTHYRVYFAASRRGATDTVNDQCIGRASSSSPTGPFVPEDTPVYCGLKKVDAGANSWGHGALDPEIFRNPSGKWYLLVSLSRTRDNIGVIGLHGDGRVVGGANAPPVTLASQGTTWHDGTDDGRLGSGAFLENPSMVYDAATQTYLLFYSAGQWYTSRYLTGFSRCATPVGPCTMDTRGPFLVGGSGRSGPGGLTAFRDGTGNLRVAYSSWTAGHENPSSNPGGIYSRQVTWGHLDVSRTSDPAAQTVKIP